MPYAIAVHGGAGDLERRVGEALRPRLEAGLLAALAAGDEVLAAGGPALDAVERAVRVLEDDPLFNAGRGASPTTTGALQLDASIMDGATLRCGAVVGVKRAVNPVSLARAVMERTPHVILAGPAADRFADRVGLRTAGREYFRDETRRRLIEQSRHGSVGAVALDAGGRLAAATSTGGVRGQMTGRVGDTPVIGAGTYADARCAVSCTGWGEEFIRHVVAGRVAFMVERGRGLADAVGEVLEQVLRPGDGGLIAVSAAHAVVMRTNAPSMACGWRDASGAGGLCLWKDEIPVR
jgi:beta-aspartyl-peptidase (threonine type)